MNQRDQQTTEGVQGAQPTLYRIQLLRRIRGFAARFDVAVCVNLLCLVQLSAAENAVEFARDIQPLLAKHCLLCHGPDDAQGGLQLHTRDKALAEVDSGEHAIVPGSPSSSELLSRVTSDDPDLRMPPEGDGLSPNELTVLRQWIDEGATWESHWAYRPLRAATPPRVRSDWRVRNEIDAFVLSKLDALNIAPSPEADRTTLIKRLYYDLLGLPPEPKDVDAFVNSQSEDAYEELVDRLLASQHFGERWGRHWLDKARYADSDGYEKDRHRADAWRYRDWVIDAINQDLPFDQFTVEQLAGDMIADAQPRQQLATAFHRQTLTNTEGGTDQEQWRVAAVMDRTETLGTVWLGLSVGCARCHSHKYDQITQSEYYQLYAYFNNGDEVTTTVPKSEWVEDTLRSQLHDIESAMAERRGELIATHSQWLPELRREVDSISNQDVAHHALENVTAQGPKGTEFEVLDDGSILVQGDNPAKATYTIEATTKAENVTGIRVEVMPDDSLPRRGPGRAKHGNFVLNEIRLFSGEQLLTGDAERRPFGFADASFSESGWAVIDAIDGIEGEGRKGTGWAISPQFGEPHWAIFALQRPLESVEQSLRIELRQTYGSQHTIGRFRISAVTGTPPGIGIPEDVQAMVLAGRVDRAAIDRFVDYYQTKDPRSIELGQQQQSLSNRIAEQSMSVRVIAQRAKNPRKTHVLRRGEFKQPLDEVSTGTLAALPPIRSRDQRAQTDRLDLAHWLVDGENPLVPRVAVNHVWKHLFGAGIVPTMNDFGVRGDPASHPDLLDHLALLLIDADWSRKRLIKTIVMSATYRQASRHRQELMDLDPNNRLLHRQNRFRVEAEIIRDITLAASGLLSPKIGGPSVFPPIPPSVTDLTYNSSFKWETSAGPDRYRRGMYTYFKRTAPHPNLITFDCPDSNVTSVQRDRSNTPIGALVTLNNDTFVEAAQAMAEQVLLHSTSNDDVGRLRYALRRCIARDPDDDEIGDFLHLLHDCRRWYEVHPDSATELISRHRVTGVSKTENAAWVSTLRMVLNLDEFITRE
ncbi:MAG: PSD1 and planctomycete cytochrome C domain-containing protein [Planctomycetota bacterium]